MRRNGRGAAEGLEPAASETAAAAIITVDAVASVPPTCLYVAGEVVAEPVTAHRVRAIGRTQPSGADAIAAIILAQPWLVAHQVALSIT
eukprot:scaffold75408_cov65-Phaeocystis_antarctica.AAC.3